MERTTKQDLQRALGWLCEAAGRTIGHEEGQWSLHYHYGWLIVEAMDRGIHHPFGNTRRSARELYDVLNFAQQAFYLREKGKAA